MFSGESLFSLLWLKPYYEEINQSVLVSQLFFLKCVKQTLVCHVTHYLLIVNLHIGTSHASLIKSV